MKYKSKFVCNWCVLRDRIVRFAEGTLHILRNSVRELCVCLTSVSILNVIIIHTKSLNLLKLRMKYLCLGLIFHGDCKIIKSWKITGSSAYVPAVVLCCTKESIRLKILTVKCSPYYRLILNAQGLVFRNSLLPHIVWRMTKFHSNTRAKPIVFYKGKCNSFN